MTQISIKGYGTVVHVDDNGHQHSSGTFNEINQTGIDRIIKSDTALNNQSYVFHNILLSKNLPRDKFVFTKTELVQYNGLLLPITKSPDLMLSTDKKTLSIDFSTSSVANTTNTDLDCDTISLTYTDGLGNHYVCSYAEFMNTVTNNLETFTVKAGELVNSGYRISLSIAGNEDNISLKFTDFRPSYLRTELSGEYISTQYAEDPSVFARSTRLPYVEGSSKLEFQVYKTTGSTWDCNLVCGLFVMSYNANGDVVTDVTKEKGIRHVVEIELVLPKDAPTKLGTVIAKPKGITETVKISDYGNGSGVKIEFKADPLSEVKFYLYETLISKTITDASGFGIAIFSSYYDDPITHESRALRDGLLITVKTINSAGTAIQAYIPVDDTPNRITHWNWIDATHLKLVGRLNDVVKVFVVFGYTKTGETLRSAEIINVKLTTPDTRYGYDAAYAIAELDLIQQQQLFYSSVVKVSLTDAAGNKNDNMNVQITVNDLGLPNLYELSRPIDQYTKKSAVNDKLFRIPLITKGTKS